MNRILLLIALAAGADAACPGSHCGVVLPATGVTATLPASSPYNALLNQSMHWESRMKDPGAGTYRYWSVGPFAFRGTGSATVAAIDDYDTLADAVQITLPSSGIGDFVIRITRDVSALVLRMEICALSNGTQTCQVISKAITSVAANSGAGFQSAGYNLARIGADFGSIAGELHFLRWCSGVVASGTPIQVTAATSGCVGYGDWELDNNGTDASAAAMNVTFSSPTYNSTANYSPSCSAGGDASSSAGSSFKIGETGQLDGTGSVALREGATFTYLWSQTTSQTSVISSTTAGAPTFTTASAAFGPINFHLVVDDGTDNASCDVYHGLVSVNASNVITSTDATVEKILLPQIWFGHNPWPAYDDWQRTWANHFGALQASPTWDDDWMDALTGTISVTNGSAVVTGTGTSFLSSPFCPSGAGAGAGDNSNNFVVWYPRGDGTYGKRSYGVATCTSNTSITLTRTYTTSANASGLSYSKFANVAGWAGGAGNINYYDAVMAFYGLYFRTGIQVYRDFARALADRWWTMPFIDEGYACRTPDGFACFSPRQWSFTGLILRALDGRSDMWALLRGYMNGSSANSPVYHYVSYAVAGNIPLLDTREDAYRSSQIALMGIADPDGTSAASFQTVLAATVVPYWAALQDADKSWHVFVPTDTTSGTIQVSASNQVVGTGTSWDANTFKSAVGGGSLLDPSQAANELWVSDGNVAYPRSCKAGYGNLAPGDGVTYVVDSINVGTQTLTLHTSYAGTPRSGVAYTYSNDNGCGVQPFMMGVVAAFADYAQKALAVSHPVEAAIAVRLTTDAADWLRTTTWTDTKGVFYGRVFPGCEPDPAVVPGCRGADSPDLSQPSIQASRYIGSETFHGLAAAYALNGDATLKIFIDDVYGAAYGYLGGPNSDSNSLFNFYNDPTFANDNGKFFAFGFGWGLGAAWPAARTAEPTSDPLTGSRVPASARLGTTNRL